MDAGRTVVVDHTPARTGLLLRALVDGVRVRVQVAPDAPPNLRAWVATLRQDVCGDAAHFEDGKHIVRIECVDESPDALTAEEKDEGERHLLERWRDLFDRGVEWVPADLGLRQCAETPAEDSVCCEDAACPTCTRFVALAEEYGVYDP